MMEGEIISGSIELKIRDVDDHHSLMHHFREAVIREWEITDEEYWDMIQESLIDCPPCYLWEGRGQQQEKNRGKVGYKSAQGVA